jgi:hypothetical protein
MSKKLWMPANLSNISKESHSHQFQRYSTKDLPHKFWDVEWTASTSQGGNREKLQITILLQ